MRCAWGTLKRKKGAVKNQASSLMSLWSVHQQKKLTTQQRNGRVRFCQWFLISGNSCQRSQQKREKLYSHIVSIAERTTIDPAAGRWRIDQVHTERLTKSNFEVVNQQIKFGRVTLLSKRFWEQTLFELARYVYLQGGLDPTKGDFDWSEIDQSRSVGAETSYSMCLSLLPIVLCWRAPLLFGRLTRAPAEKNEFPNFAVTEEGKKAWWKK